MSSPNERATTSDNPEITDNTRDNNGSTNRTRNNRKSNNQIASTNLITYEGECDKVGGVFTLKVEKFYKKVS